MVPSSIEPQSRHRAGRRAAAGSPRADHDLAGLRGRCAAPVGTRSSTMRSSASSLASDAVSWLSPNRGRRVWCETAFSFLERLRQARLIERLEQVVDCVDLECLDGVAIESGGEDDLRQPRFAVGEYLFEHRKAVEAGHLYVEEKYVRLVCADEIDGLNTVAALRQHLHAARGFEQVVKLLPGEWLVVDDHGGQVGRLVHSGASSMRYAC